MKMNGMMTMTKKNNTLILKERCFISVYNSNGNILIDCQEIKTLSFKESSSRTDLFIVLK